MTRKQARDRVERARRIAGPKDALAVYRDWARDYDRDIAGELNFIGSDRIAELLAEHLPDRTAHIIDLGCGTGLVGHALQQLGFSHLDGLDLSPEMLAVARRKAVYAQTLQANLLEPLDLPDCAYNAAISAGTFTTGHVDATALPEIMRILRPGGILACVIADAVWQEGGFASAFSIQAGQLRHHSQEPISLGGRTEAHYLVVQAPEA